MKYLSGCLLAGAAVAIWGSQNTVLRFLYGENPSGFDPYSFAFLRNLAGTLFLFCLIGFRREWNAFAKMLKTRRKELFFLALCGIALKGYCQIASPMFTTAARASLFGASAPVFTLLFARMFLKEKICFRQVLGVLLGAAGIGAALFSVGIDCFGEGKMLAGDVIAFAGGILWGFYNVFSGKLTRDCGSVSTVSGVMLIGTLLMAIPISPGALCSMTLPLYAGALYLGCISIGAALILWGLAAKMLPAATLGVFGYVSLLISMLFSHVLLQERFSLLFLLSALLLFAGTCIAVVSGKRSDPDDKEGS